MANRDNIEEAESRLDLRQVPDQISRIFFGGGKPEVSLRRKSLSSLSTVSVEFQ